MIGRKILILPMGTLICFRSLRIWNVNESKKQLHVIKGRDKQGN